MWPMLVFRGNRSRKMRLAILESAAGEASGTVPPDCWLIDAQIREMNRIYIYASSSNYSRLARLLRRIEDSYRCIFIIHMER
jgi:hypothetical protein